MVQTKFCGYLTSVKYVYLIIGEQPIIVRHNHLQLSNTYYLLRVFMKYSNDQNTNKIANPYLQYCMYCCLTRLCLAFFECHTKLQEVLKLL